MPRRQTASRGLIASLVLGLYALACALPAMDGHGGTVRGLQLLLWGWLAPLCWAPWSANLLLGGGLLALACRNYRGAATLGWLAAGLALTAWALDTHYLLGYYLWQASPILLALGARVLSCQDTFWREQRESFPQCPTG